MKIFRHLGLMIAVFWCAAMVVAPVAAAAVAGQAMNQASGPQGMNPGPGNQGNNQMQPGQGTGSGNGQNTGGPGQGNQQQGMIRENRTEFGNMTHTEKPDWDPDNSTALNKTVRHGPWDANMTGMNMTDMPPRGDFDPANLTALNRTAWHGDGNLTPPAPPAQGNTAGQGQQGNANQLSGQNQQQAQNQNTSDDSLIAGLIDWLKAHGVT